MIVDLPPLMKLDTLRKTALLAGGLRLLFLFLPQQYQEYCTQENCQLFVQWRDGFFCVKDDCRFDENFIKTQLALRSMEWQLFVLVEIEENLPQDRSPNIAL